MKTCIDLKKPAEIALYGELIGQKRLATARCAGIAPIHAYKSTTGKSANETR